MALTEISLQGFVNTFILTDAISFPVQVIGNSLLCVFALMFALMFAQNTKVVGVSEK